MGMALVRYLSVVRLQRHWHMPKRTSFWSSRYIWMILAVALLIAAPPLIGFGTYAQDTAKFW